VIEELGSISTGVKPTTAWGREMREGDAERINFHQNYILQREAPSSKNKKKCIEAKGEVLQTAVQPVVAVWERSSRGELVGDLRVGPLPGTKKNLQERGGSAFKGRRGMMKKS